MAAGFLCVSCHCFVPVHVHHPARTVDCEVYTLKRLLMTFWSPRNPHVGINDNSSQNKDTASVKLYLWYTVVLY